MKRILIIEDDPDILDNTIEILSLENFEVVTALDGLEGLEQVSEQQPDMILCDIRLPLMDGYEVFETLREDPLTAAIPFVFMSSNANEDDIERVRASGIDYLVKPFEIVALLSLVKYYVHPEI